MRPRLVALCLVAGLVVVACGVLSFAVGRSIAPEIPGPTVTVTAEPTVVEVEVPVEVEPAVCLDAIQIAYDGFAAFRAALHSTGDERADYLARLDVLRPRWLDAARTCEEMT